MTDGLITFQGDFRHRLLLEIYIYMYMYMRKIIQCKRELGYERNGTGF